MQNGKLIQLSLLTALAPMIWGSTYIVTTELLPEGRPFIAAAIRVLPAGLFLLLISRKLPLWKDLPRVLLLSFLNIAFFQAMLFVAAYKLPGGIAGAIGSVQPLFVIFFIWFFESAKPKLTSLIFTLTAMAGMLMILVRGNVELNTAGVVCGFAGAVAMALGIYLSSKWKFGVSNLTFTGWQLLFGGIMLLPVALILEPLPEALVLKNYIGYAYLCVFGALVSYFLWFRGITGGLPPLAVALLGFLSPVTAIFNDLLFLDKNLTAIQYAGFVLVLFSIAMVQKSVLKK
ncbi:MAG: EamA family transporter [Deferribacterales bacterium]